MDEIVEQFELNTYQVPIKLVLESFDTYAELELAVRETVASSIVNNVDALDEGDTAYVTTRVDFDTTGLEQTFEDGDTDHVILETSTPLGIIND